MSSGGVPSECFPLTAATARSTSGAPLPLQVRSPWLSASARGPRTPSSSGADLRRRQSRRITRNGHGGGRRLAVFDPPAWVQGRRGIQREQPEPFPGVAHRRVTEERRRDHDRRPWMHHNRWSTRCRLNVPCRRSPAVDPGQHDDNRSSGECGGDGRTATTNCQGATFTIPLTITVGP